MSLNDVLELDATAQADLIRKKQISPLELAEAAIGRAEAVNPKINAIVAPLYERAREAARGPLPDGPFTGVPFLVTALGIASSPRLAERLRRMGPGLERVAGVSLVVLGVLLATNTYVHLTSYLARFVPAVHGL